MKRLAILAALCALLFAIAPAPAAQAGGPPGFDAAAKTRVLDAAEKALGDYLYPKIGAQAIATLRSRRDAYMQIDDPQAFAAAVTKDLYASTHDLHEKLYYSPTELPDERAQGPRDLEIMRQSHENHMQGIASLRQLYGNIGYIDVMQFETKDEAKPAIDAAMTVLTHTDALIIDLRRNGGGSDANRYLLGYFFQKPVDVNDFHYVGQPVMHGYTYRVDGPSYGNKPVFVLTSNRTGSAAEEFAYDMQTQHRATLVGTRTAGAANPGRMYKLDPHFQLFVALGYVENPVTHTNWEGKGVQPDVPTADAQSALLTAYELALKAAHSAFDETLLERKQALEDPAKALALSLSV